MQCWDPRLLWCWSVVNFINVKRANFTYESLFSSYVLALNELLYKKRTCKTLMKLTPACLWMSSWDDSPYVSWKKRDKIEMWPLFDCVYHLKQYLARIFLSNIFLQIFYVIKLHFMLFSLYMMKFVRYDRVKSCYYQAWQFLPWKKFFNFSFDVVQINRLLPDYCECPGVNFINILCAPILGLYFGAKKFKTQNTAL